ncbi:MAG: MerR family transcriptional regulator [Nocardioides sp.]|uniref:MerR family transcriptional regulator n=1 Tax=Nocardioides sp. TaxID=35761 RepID=UPI0039E28FF0
MATEALIERLMQHIESTPDAAVVDVLHDLLDDSTVEDSAPPLGVAEAAALLGLSPHTLRYYEDQGLVHPGRTTNGYREYSAVDLRRLVFLTRMRVSGMTMSDLRHYLALVERGEATIPQRRQIMLDQRDRIRRQIRELTLALEATEYKLHTYTPAD